MAAPNFKLVSKNIASSKRIELIREILKTEKPHLLLLQEVTIPTAQLMAAVTTLNYKCESNIDMMNPSQPGTALVWRADLPVRQVDNIETCHLQSITICDQSFLNVYTPSGSANRRERQLLFARDMFPRILAMQADLLPVLAGDWNCLLNAEDTTANFRDKFSKDLDNLVKAFKYRDSYRVLHPQTVEFTFYRASCSPARLDRVYLPPQLLTSLQSVSHHPEVADHWSVHVELQLGVARLQPPPRNPRTYWKLNNTILQHESFLPQLRTLFRQLEEEQATFPDLADWWDEYAKPGCISFCKSFSATLGRQRKSYKRFLYALLRQATASQNWILVTQTKEKLKTIIRFELDGLLVRSRQGQNSEEELASIYHQNKVKKTNVIKLKVPGGGGTQVETEDPQVIEDALTNFFDSLLNGRMDKDLNDTGQQFQPDYSDLEDFLSNLTALSPAAQAVLEKELSLEELQWIIKTCPYGSAPGLDGLTYEFYRAAWPVIGKSFHKVLQVQLARCRITESGRLGATKLIPKVEVVPEVKDLRPITLLQVDYRILSKCLASRLHGVIGEVVQPGQLATGGGNILTGVYEILASIDYINKTNSEGYLFSGDLHKAFDRAMLAYLEVVTERMQFPEVFRDWLKMLHAGATTQLILASGFSRRITVTFSFRQGDCIAGDLYCLVQEPLLRMLRKHLAGLQVTNFSQKDVDYMDDVQFVSGNVKDLATFDRIMLKFEAQSGALLSRDRKTKVMGLGRWQGKEDWPAQVHWIETTAELGVLGLVICPKYRDTLQRSWEKVFRGFQRTIFSWRSRLLCTLQQRVTVVQTFALSKVWYVAQVLPLPSPVAKKIESLISSFIFQGRHERLKLAELQNPSNKGGLGLSCVTTKAECLLLRQSLRILARPQQTCSQHLGHWLGFFLQEDFPDLMERGPVCQALLPQYPLQSAMLEVLQEGLTRLEFTPDTLQATTRIIYKGRIEDVIQPPKVESDFPGVDFPGLVYPRLSHAVLEPGPRDILFSLVHGIYKNRAKLFRQHRAQDDSCPVPECQGAVQDREHIFCSCSRVLEAWLWTRSRLLQLLPGIVGAVGTSNEEFILLQYPADTLDLECVWLLGNYMEIVDSYVVAKNRILRREQLRGILRTRLLGMSSRAVVWPQILNI